MHQRLMIIWQRLTTRRAAAPTAPLDTVTQQHQDLTRLRWWYWRHYFLEAKRQQLDAQRDQ